MRYSDGLTAQERYRLRNKDNPEYKKRLAEKARKYANRHKGTPRYKAKRREYALRSVYGITGEEYNKMLIEQDNCCKICLRHASTFSKGLYVDHCHSTGKVRGLLCVTCNNFLGAINDNPDRSDFIKEYLS